MHCTHLCEVHLCHTISLPVVDSNVYGLVPKRFILMLGNMTQIVLVGLSSTTSPYIVEYANLLLHLCLPIKHHYVEWHRLCNKVP
jgi:hypothetical protein